jgi:hypothetical protein
MFKFLSGVAAGGALGYFFPEVVESVINLF